MMRSESTRAFGQPRDTNETFGAGAFIRHIHSIKSKLTSVRRPPKAASSRIHGGETCRSRAGTLCRSGSIVLGFAQFLAWNDPAPRAGAPRTTGARDLRRACAFTTPGRPLQHPALTRALITLGQTSPVPARQFPDDPVREELKLGFVAAGEGAGLGIEQAEGPEPDVLQEDQGSSGIEPDMGGAGDEGIVLEPLVGQGILTTKTSSLRIV